MISSFNPRSSDRGWHTAAAILITILLATPGCAKRESRQETHTTDSTAAQTSPGGSESAARPESAPSDLPATPVGGSDSLINTATAKLTPWVQMWRQADAGFSPDSLYRAGVAPAFRKGVVQPLKNVYPPPTEDQPVFLILSAHSPGGRYNLIFDRYLNIRESGEEIDVGGDADHAPLLLDLQRATANQFETCGPSCTFDWGVWLSPTTFVLAGSQELGNGQRAQGSVGIYSLADSTATTYVTRPVSPAARARYRAAWQASLVKKYRAMKNSTGRN